MLIIVDRKISERARQQLIGIGNRTSAPGKPVSLLDLETDGIVYPAISGHPDIFFCKTPEKLVVSPNLPEKYKEILKESGTGFLTGLRPSGIRHPASVHYNASINDRYLVHRLEFTDPVILENCHSLKKIGVKQGYTRCSLLLLHKDHYITSDPGIHETLVRQGLDGIFVSPAGIVLSGYPHGFIGGTAGLSGNTVVFTGSLNQFPEGQKIRNYLTFRSYQIASFNDGPLIDSGGLFFLAPTNAGE